MSELFSLFPFNVTIDMTASNKSLSLIANVFLSRSYLKDSFAAYRIPGWRFSFSTLNVLSSVVFYEKSSINTIFFLPLFPLLLDFLLYIYVAVVDVPQISKPLFIVLQGFLIFVL